MGPISLFDKSFIQSLSVDESVWFDNFFYAVVCPIFYAETLADLSKTMKGDKSPYDEVTKIADKFPDMSGTPCQHHLDLCIGNLLGNPVPMNGRIVPPGGYPVVHEGKTGYVFDGFPETEAFNRWQNGDYQYIEDHMAKEWRNAVSNLDLEQQAEVFRKLGINSKTCKSLEDAKNLAEGVLHQAKPYDQMAIAVHFLNIPRQYQQGIMERWHLFNLRPIAEYAPYAAYVLLIELFFQVAIASKLIATERPSNRIDISYLFYLPFSMVFISSDKLHRRCAPLFLRSNQEFVWGQDLKGDLGKINLEYSNLPDEIKELGVLSFARTPPQSGDYLTAKIWDRHASPKWRESDEISKYKPKKNEKLVGELRKFGDAPPAELQDVDLENIESMTLKRMVRKKKGQWFQINKEIEPSES